jgi:prepilin-type N-terminal cleavage/methylation domain-containing protein
MPDLAGFQHMMRYNDDQGGFTLIELIASLFLVGLLTAVFGMGLVAAIQGYDYNRANVEVTQKAQMAMARISRELQELVDIVEIADSDQDPFIIYDRVTETSGRSEQHTFGLHFNPGDGRLRLYTNLDEGGVPTALSDSTLEDGDILIDQVQSFSLQFFQGQNPWTEDMDITLLSTIEITLQISRSDAPDKTETFQTLIHLRNTQNEGGATV